MKMGDICGDGDNEREKGPIDMERVCVCVSVCVCVGGGRLKKVGEQRGEAGEREDRSKDREK